MIGYDRKRRSGTDHKASLRKRFQRDVLEQRSSSWLKDVRILRREQGRPQKNGRIGRGRERRLGGEHAVNESEYIQQRRVGAYIAGLTIPSSVQIFSAHVRNLT
ncbi:hypothetical protein BDM02DRAFT_1885915 [Thelephora ganbajun]|uniref:Uncharacterized protein n=1 Tax=Thelephora ganbajun TaxID=370292 RepID=A0ACB6ZUG7_THEGA|nr:hypothetical protein BDM02DRAFT_1885915 [Thelephora ganbajun]